MEGYIVIKKRTFFAAVAALAVAATAVLTWHFGIFGGIEKSMPQTAIRSYNTLSADGNNILYFTGISNDSTLTGITFDSKTIMFGSATAPYASELRAIIRHSKDSLENRIAFLEATMDEMGYYLKVHGVQDEGYDMVAGHYTATEKEIASLRQLADALESIGPKAKVKVDHTCIQKAQARPGKPKEVFVACNGGRWKNGIWLKVPNEGHGIGTDSAGRIISGVWKADTLTTGLRSDTSGIYRGLFSAGLDAHGHGTYTRHNGTYYEGHWKGDSRNGFGFSVDSERLRAGEWLSGRKAELHVGKNIRHRHIPLPARTRKALLPNTMGQAAHNRPRADKHEENKRHRRLSSVFHIHKINRRHLDTQQILQGRLPAGTKARHTLRRIPFLFDQKHGTGTGQALHTQLVLQERRPASGARC